SDEEPTEQGQPSAPANSSTDAAPVSTEKGTFAASRPWPGDVRRLGGRYVLEEPIARGGVAVVWRAYDERLGRSVAVKILLPHVATDAVTTERFRREMVTAAAVAHPNVVSIYDTGQIGDMIFLVMEHVDGPSLKDVLRELGPLDPIVTAALGEQVASALAEAHATGLVHRDVKPANILLTSQGVVKVTDFGIATAVDDDQPTLTAEGKVVGTAAYLSPEQLQGRTADPRVDVYSLGIVLYECLVGRPPFQGDTPTATASARLTQDVVPPRQLRADVPRDLDAIVVRATQRQIEKRFDDAKSMAAALTQLVPAAPTDLTSRLVDGQEVPQSIATTQMPGRPDGAPTRARYVTRLIAAFAVGLLAATGALLLSRTLSGEPAQIPLLSGSLPVATSSDFDPFGDPPQEHPDEVTNAHDGDPRTAWTTERYRGQSRFGGLKVGAGIWFDLGPDARPAILEVDLVLPGASFEVFAVDELPDAVDGLIGWNLPRFTVEQAATATALAVGNVPAQRYWLLWFTELPQNPDGLFQAAVSEVRFLARDGAATG
ncbi:MAG: serine/threonine protein kinase, partial [Glaciecola sp.]